MYFTKSSLNSKTDYVLLRRVSYGYKEKNIGLQIRQNRIAIHGSLFFRL